MEAGREPAADKPSCVLELQNVFGGPSQSAFGSAVFFDAADQEELEKQGLAIYKHFAGKTWE